MAYDEVCNRCHGIKLILNRKYEAMKQGKESSNAIMNLLNDRMEKIKNEPLPESYIVSRDEMFERADIDPVLSRTGSFLL